MRNKNKTIYIVGGTNGVGKSALYRSGLLKKEIPYINADFIAKELAGGKEPTKRQYELAQDFCTAQIKNLMAAGRSFAFENNMHEEANYKWLQDTQLSEGYRIELYYVGVEELKITTSRIRERLKSGDHFVPADQVIDRYEKGMKLLEKYYEMPDQLTLIDNTINPFVCYQLQKGQKIFQAETLPGWAKQFAEAIEAKTKLSNETKENISSQMKSLTDQPGNESKKNDLQIKKKNSLLPKKGKAKRKGLRP